MGEGDRDEQQKRESIIKFNRFYACNLNEVQSIYGLIITMKPTVNSRGVIGILFRAWG